MIRQNNISNLKKSWTFKILVAFGTILNLIAVFTDGNGALVAVGCSLIAIGAATAYKNNRDPSA